MPPLILVVDDEPNIVLSIEYLMRRSGYETRIAHNGKAALQALRERAPDLVLLDVTMPDHDGYAVCQQMRTNPLWRAIPIIMLTARGRDVEREKGLALGANDYITKPFSTKALIERVKAHLGTAKRGG
ncbi:MAG: response regulator transcription factor [Kiloniellales bacterium]